MFWVEDFIAFYNRGKRPDLYFWRSNDGLEVDLIIKIGQCLYPIEINIQLGEGLFAERLLSASHFWLR